MNYPVRWREYVDSMKAAGSSPASSYAAFASRFRAAKSLTGMTFDQLSAASVDSYFLATKLGFVDSAFEALENASNADVGSLGVFDQDIAYSIWEERLAELSEALSLLRNRKLASQWKEFCELDKDQVQLADLRFLLRAFRHLNAHGIFTPGSASVYQSKKLRGLLFELTEVGLKQMENHFSSFLDDGVLPIAQESSESMEQISSAKLQGSFYIGSVIGVEEMTDGCLLLQRTEEIWQILDMTDWTLSALFSEKPSQKSLRATHDYDYRFWHEGIEKMLANLTNGDSRIWQLTHGDWLIGTAKGFTRYNPVTQELGTSITIPRDLLPKYLNYRTLGLAKDGSFAIVGMDSLERTYLFLDLVKMQARQMKIPGIPAAYHAKYLGLTDVIVSLDEAKSSLNFYRAQPFDVPDPKREKELRPLGLGVTWTVSLGGDRNPWSSRADVYKDMFRVSRDGLASATRSGVSFWRKNIFDADDSDTVFSLPVRPESPFVSENLDFVVDSELDTLVLRTDKDGTSRIRLTNLRVARISSHYEVTDQLIFVGRKNGAVAFVNPTPLTLVKEMETTLDEAHAASMLSERAVAVIGRANGPLVIQVWDTVTQMQLDSRTLIDSETSFTYKMLVDHLGGHILVSSEYEPGIRVIDTETLETKMAINQDHKTQEVWIDQIERRAYVLRKNSLTLQILNADTFLEEDVYGLPSQGMRLSFAAESKELFVACESGFLTRLAIQKT